MTLVLERFVDRPPMTANTGMRDEMTRAMKRHIREWRTWAASEAHDRGWPPITRPVAVDVVHLRRTRSAMPDVGALLFVAKAIVDGLVDAAVLPNDGPDTVRTLTFRAPEVAGVHGVRLVLRELELHLPAPALGVTERPALLNDRLKETS